MTTGPEARTSSTSDATSIDLFHFPTLCLKKMSDITEIYRLRQWVERGLFLSFSSNFSISKVKQEEIQNIQRKPIFTKGVPPL